MVHDYKGHISAQIMIKYHLKLILSTENGIFFNQYCSNVKRQKSKVKSQISKVKCQKLNVKSQMSKVKIQISKVKCQKLNVNSQMSKVKTFEKIGLPPIGLPPFELRGHLDEPHLY